MKRKNGFTLVEILVTISLLSLIMIIVVPSVISINKKVKNKLYSTKVSQAEEATILWVQDNHNCLSNDDDSCMINKNNCKSYDENKIQCTITMEDLAENNLIKYDDEDNKKIYSPIDNASMNKNEISFIYNLKTKLISINSKKTSTMETKNTTTITTTKKTSTTATKETSTTTTTKKTTTTTTKIVAKNENDCLNLYDEDSGTLLAAIKNNYQNAPIATKTTPGEQISAEDEAVLAATEDDYGYSLYFRGAVKDNYVEFAKKCWRIVRITGDCSIKLVLHNDNVNSVASPCASTNNSKSAAFAKYTSTTYISEFNHSSNKNAYVGFMYGTPGSNTYALEHENKNDSTILTNLKTWYNSYLKSYDNKLADTIWCNDKSTYQNTSYKPLSIGTIGTEYGTGTNKNFYSATSRIVSPSNKLGSAATGISPTLVCPNDDNNDNLSKYTSEDTINGNGALKGYKIGLLTADEIVFAGGGYNTANKTHYLCENASDTFWWTSSPSYFENNSYVFGGSANGNVIKVHVSTSAGVRPSVSLVSSITISGGTGTSSNPFVITAD